MTKLFPLLFLALLAIPNCVSAADGDAPERQPNMIVILADDMGYSDPGCFGGEIATPSLNRLASEGTRLTRFYNCGMCITSRATMLTGQWWPRSVPHFENSRLLPEHLQAVGYQTALIGKWHLKGQPMDRGFDHFFGFLNGFADHFSGGPGYRLDREPFRNYGQNYYSSDALTDRAISFVERSSKTKPDQPFFVYLSFQAPHNPLQAPRRDIMRCRGKYLQGWQNIRDARFERQKKLGIVSADAQLPPYPQNLPAWESLSDAQQDLEDLRMSVYAAMVERMDAGIGRLVASLEKSGQADNTLVLFLSDNGTDSFSVVDKAMLKKGRLPGDRSSNWQPGTGWAYASVTPWRQYKIAQHAGGITTGAIAWWPGKTKTPGRIDSTPLHLIDILPTLADAASISEEATGTIAGTSFLPILAGQPIDRQQPLYFQYMDNRAIRTPQWTLAEVDASGWELFDTRQDPLETTDLSAEHPDIVASLDKQWSNWWQKESGKTNYQPESTRDSPHYSPQGDRGTGTLYVPSAMPAELADRYPVP